MPLLAVPVVVGWLVLDELLTKAETATRAVSDIEAFAEQVKAWQIAAAAAVGAGGVITLATVFHRQALAARAAADARYDADEKRAQELFVKAVEQLGHAAAAVRVGALHALDALGQEHEGRRRAVMDVWCAYLRMPPPEKPDAEEGKPARPWWTDLIRPRRKTRPPPEPTPQEATWPAEELQVRATAQRLITEHLHPPDKLNRKKKQPKPSGAFWGAMDIDLSGAHLHYFNLSNYRLGKAMFDGVTFHGGAGFDGVIFHGDAGFNGATFHGNAGFELATFNGNARFYRATFNGNAKFQNVIFRPVLHGCVMFGGATFTRHAEFRGATFTGDAWFDGATFAGHAEFIMAKFARQTRFDMATFAGHTRFDGATFTTFDRTFDDARVLELGADHVLPQGWTVGADDGKPGRPLEGAATAPNVSAAEEDPEAS
ncbi:pentapeptide repeat-containing protein [Phytomonospora sp. NPDC050363]|uniref:pentapeptide repeat-containing protein n=1 Tax=Phytomonospora sp. NPDC050363 TaxID=3155642 RepID=UPI0033F5B125